MLMSMPAINKGMNALCLLRKLDDFFVENKYEIIIKAAPMDIIALANINMLNNISVAAIIEI